MIVIDSQPTADGALAVAGNLEEEPTAFWNFDPATDAEFWKVPADIPRFDRHRCAGTL